MRRLRFDLVVVQPERVVVQPELVVVRPERVVVRPELVVVQPNWSWAARSRFAAPRQDDLPTVQTTRLRPANAR